MAFPNTFAGLVAGTPMVWNSAGGSGGGGTITCTSLANNAARQGTKSTVSLADTTKGMPVALQVKLECKMAVAPSDGVPVDIFLSFSSSATAGTDNMGPGVISGTDAAVTNAAALSIQGQLVLVGALSLSGSNGAGTGAQRASLEVVPVDAYFSPMIGNNIENVPGGQAFSGTAADTILTITPFFQPSS